MSELCIGVGRCQQLGGRVTDYSILRHVLRQSSSRDGGGVGGGGGWGGGGWVGGD